MVNNLVIGQKDAPCLFLPFLLTNQPSPSIRVGVTNFISVFAPYYFFKRERTEQSISPGGFLLQNAPSTSHNRSERRRWTPVFLSPRRCRASFSVSLSLSTPRIPPTSLRLSLPYSPLRLSSRPRSRVRLSPSPSRPAPLAASSLTASPGAASTSSLRQEYKDLDDPGL